MEYGDALFITPDKKNAPTDAREMPETSNFSANNKENRRSESQESSAFVKKCKFSPFDTPLDKKLQNVAKKLLGSNF